MINEEKYSNSLFIFNDNISHHHTNIKGGGNAIIRPFNKYGKGGIIRSSGIPTCKYIPRKISKRFSILSEIFYNKSAKEYIDESIEEIKNILKNNKSEDNNLIGDKIFNIGLDVKKYITEKIYELIFKNYF